MELFESRFRQIRACFSLEEDSSEEPCLVIDKRALIATLQEFAECDWDAGADGHRDGLKNPHAVKS